MKEKSVKFWISFWSIAILFLAGWFLFWEMRNKGIESIVPVLETIPFFDGEGEDYKNALKIAGKILAKDDSEKVFMVLFQNNMEIRPGGGFIGAFGILKIKNGEITSIETHDLSNFDARIPDTVEPPYPMKETLGIKSWKLRDSNYSPDFETNAKKAEEFYYMGQGGEKFDGIIGITTNVFSSILKVTGPVQLPDYPGTYDSENAVITLEYQVEKDFENQGIDRGDRKSIMTELAQEIENKISSLDSKGKINLGKEIINDLNKKEIQLYFKEQELQEVVRNAGWDGKVKESSDDYLMLVDANLGAFKSDYYVQRKVEYVLDFFKEIPTATLKINYNHTAKQKDWMTRDYLSYLRVYVPKDAWLSSSENFGDPKFGNEFGKKFFGGIVKVPIGSEKLVTITYTLPKEITEENYDLLIQKQSGILDVPYKVTITGKDGAKKEKEFRLNSDTVLSEI
jgi:hypothetical protein